MVIRHRLKSRWQFINAGLLVIMTLLSSCKNEAIIDEFKPVPNRLWNYGFTPSFDVKVTDKEVVYKLKVNVRLSADYKYANLFLLIHQTNPDTSETLTKRIELKVADKDGRWLGKGVGSLYSYQIAYHTNYHFPDTGIYQFRIEQNMRDNPLKGISDIGICVLPESTAQ